jgi:hypothetical protein
LRGLYDRMPATKQGGQTKCRENRRLQNATPRPKEALIKGSLLLAWAK